MPRHEKIPFLGRDNDEEIMTMDKGNVNTRLNAPVHLGSPP